MLPKNFILPENLIPDIRDQKKYNICVAMAITAVLQIVYYKKTGKRVQFSPTWGAVMWRSDVEGQKNMASLVTDSAIPAMIDVGAVLTNRYYTPAAKDMAARTKIILWDREDLFRLICHKKQ
jgi:hypothetical protein